MTGSQCSLENKTSAMLSLCILGGVVLGQSMYAILLAPKWLKDGHMAGQAHEIQFQEHERKVSFSTEIIGRYSLSLEESETTTWKKLAHIWLTKTKAKPRDEKKQSPDDTVRTPRSGHA